MRKIVLDYNEQDGIVYDPISGDHVSTWFFTNGVNWLDSEIIDKKIDIGSIVDLCKVGLSAGDIIRMSEAGLI